MVERGKVRLCRPFILWESAEGTDGGTGKVFSATMLWSKRIVRTGTVDRSEGGVSSDTDDMERRGGRRGEGC